MKRLPILILAIAMGLGTNCALAQSVETGKRQYEARCVGCHGADGSGGGHGPAIVGLARPRASTQDAVRVLIQKGIPGAGMPAFPIPDDEAGAIASYVMRLKQPEGGRPAAGAAAQGDTAAGERFFNGKGNCAGCHMVRGRGGILGPDLSNIGRERQPAQIEQALRDPGSVIAPAAGRGGRGGRGEAPLRIKQSRCGSKTAVLTRDRKKRESVRPSTARDRRQTASAGQGPGSRGDP